MDPADNLVESKGSCEIVLVATCQACLHATSDGHVQAEVPDLPIMVGV